MGHCKLLINWKWQKAVGALLKYLLLFAAVACLFYGNPLFLLLGLPFLVPLVKRDLKKAREKEEARMLLGFHEALQALKTALRAGYAMENALSEALADLVALYGEKEPIVAEFRRMENEIRMHIPLETVIASFAKRHNLEDIRSFSVIFQTAKRTGGNLVEVINNTADAIEEKNQVRRHIDSVLSAKKLEWHIMSLVPFGILGYLRLCFPQFLSSLYGNAAGILIMSFVLLGIAGAFFLGERILTFEV